MEFNERVLLCAELLAEQMVAHWIEYCSPNVCRRNAIQRTNVVSSCSENQTTKQLHCRFLANAKLLLTELALLEEREAVRHRK
jgi:hypothetical protein